MTSLPLTLSLRIPRGLWNDLEETIIHQDRQFLTEVARSLGLPVPEVLRRCLGTGAPQVIPLLWSDPKTDEPEQCPWWECYGDGMWRRCPRLRLSAALPCQTHERCTPCSSARLHSDPVIRGLPFFLPVRKDGQIYWVDPTGVAPPFREDGAVETEFTFRRITHRGSRIWVRSRN